MVSVNESINILSAVDIVIDSYLDYSNWGRVFPLTISYVHLIRSEAGVLTLGVQHKTAGEVINELSMVSPHCRKLNEYKPLYRAEFINHFQEIDGATRYIVFANISMKGFLTVLEPFIKGIIQKKIIKYVLLPMKIYVEAKDC